MAEAAAAGKSPLERNFRGNQGRPRGDPPLPQKKNGKGIPENRQIGGGSKDSERTHGEGGEGFREKDSPVGQGVPAHHQVVDK
mmetsp:Transcript_25676/g.56499  ORF Transcript_25676/g.56499 Transcript_25676/m.56499 type:complete len:83 (+) Transcript_25676:1558-1806(+)